MSPEDAPVNSNKNRDGAGRVAIQAWFIPTLVNVRPGRGSH